MKINFICIASLSASLLTGTASFGQDFQTISRPDIAANNCSAEWAALVEMDPELWADTQPIGVDPSFEQTETDAFNKYFLWTMAHSEHFASLLAFEDPETEMDWNKAKAMFALSSCLTMTAAEKDLIVDAYHAARPSRSKELIRSKLFEAFDKYNCMGFAEASAQVFNLDRQSSSFQSDYAQIMSTTVVECS